MKCKKCGTENALTAKFCESCGNELNKKLIRVHSNEGYSYIDLQGNIVIGPFERLTPFYNGYTFSEHGIFDEQGNRVKEGSAYLLKHYNTVAYMGDLLDLSLNSIIPDTMSISSNGVAVAYEIKYNNYRVGYIYDGKDERRVETKLPEHEELLGNGVEQGLLGPDGKIIFSTAENKYSNFYVEWHSCAEVKDGEPFYYIISVNQKYAIINCITGKIVYDFIENSIMNVRKNVYHIPDKNTYIYIANDKVVYESDKVIENDYSLDMNYVIINDEKHYLFEDGTMSKPEDFNDAQKAVLAEQIMEKEKNRAVFKGFQIIDNFKKSSEIDKLITKKWNDMGYTRFNSPKDPNDPYKFSKKGLKYYDKVIIDCTKAWIEYFDMDTYEKLNAAGKPCILTDDSLVNIKTGEVLKTFKSVRWVRYTPYLRCIMNEGEEPVLYSMLNDKTIPVSKDDSTIILDDYFIVSRDDKWYYYNNDCKLIYEGNIIPEEKEIFDKYAKEKEEHLLGYTTTTKVKSISEIKSDLDNDLKDNRIYQGIKKIVGFFKKDK